MAKERRRGRRRHRKDKLQYLPGQPLPRQRRRKPEQAQAGPPTPTQGTDSLGLFSRVLRRGGRPEEEERRQRQRPQRERDVVGGPRPDVSPLAFWRRGRPRPLRERPLPRQTIGRLWRRFTGFYFPPWVPVVTVILVVFAILGALFFARGATAKPRVGDHWHAAYEITICGERQPNVPEWNSGVHTHSDGIVHIHPFAPFEEGAGASLVKWFEYGGDALGTGGKLSKDTLHVPGQDKEYKNGDLCQGGEFDGQPGVVQVFVNGERMGDFDRYIPKDGDSIRIIFAPEEKAFVEEEGIVIPPEEATREVAIEAGDRGNPTADSFFDPNAFTIETEETVKINVKNTGSITHNLRVEGVDREYYTKDDFATKPLIIKPGEEGFTVVRIDQPGQYAFRCDIHPLIQFGTLTVEGQAPPSEEEAATPTAEGEQPTPSEEEAAPSPAAEETPAEEATPGS